MTASANPLIPRANAPAGVAAGAGVPTLPSGDLRVIAGALAHLGYDVEELLASVGLGGLDLADPDGRVPCTAYGDVLGAAQRKRFTPNLALRLAQHVPIGAFPLLDYLVLTSDTVGAGVRQLGRCFRLVSSPIVFDIREDALPIEVRLTLCEMPFMVEYTASLIVLHLRKETEGGFAAVSASFAHRPDDAAEFERVFGCAIRGGAPWSGLSVAPDVWRLPLRRSDPVLRAILERQAEEVLARMPVRDGMAAEVGRVLAARVNGGDTRIAEVARQLATSPRTLQRRLAAAGVSYQELLDAARREVAGQHVSGSRMSISEVAYLLGYSEPAPFHRAFKRWYGVTPQAFRKARQGAAAP
jgi:AraC-like DNA-binding protein